MIGFLLNWFKPKTPNWFPTWWDENTVQLALEILNTPVRPPNPKGSHQYRYIWEEGTCCWAPNQACLQLIAQEQEHNRRKIIYIDVSDSSAKELESYIGNYGHDFNTHDRKCKCGLSQLDFIKINKKNQKLCEGYLKLSCV